MMQHCHQIYWTLEVNHVNLAILVFQKGLLVRKMLCTARFKLHSLIDGSGYTMIVPEIWRFGLLV